MKTCILQISYLPNYSFFHLMNKCHLTILLDDMKRAKTNVAHIKGKDLEIPVSEWSYFNETKINKNSSWKEDHLKAMRIAYGEMPHFKEIYDIFEKRYNEKPRDIHQMQAPELLVDICFDLIVWIKGYLDIPSDITFASKLGFTGFNYEERCALMCQAAGSTQYIGYEEVNRLHFPHMSVTKIPEPKGLSIIESLFEKGKECLK